MRSFGSVCGRAGLALTFTAASLSTFALTTAPAAEARTGAGAEVVAARAALPACTITGTRRNDVLVGTKGRDVICGRGGSDELRGRGGNDVLIGGPGNDFLIGGPGADTLEGQGGLDRLIGDAGNDSLRGGPGNDLFAGGTGRDLVRYDERTVPVEVTIGVGANDGAGAEQDSVGSDIERVWGGAGADVLVGTPNGDELRGFGGADTLRGLGGADKLIGDDGNDLFQGGAGVDTLICGAGTDDYDFDGTDAISEDCELETGNQAPFGLGIVGGSVAEDAPIGTTVGSFYASDPDPGDSLTYVFDAGSPAQDLFVIEGSLLKTASTLDYESAAEYELWVRVKDQNEATSEKYVLVISVTDVSDTPPVAVDDVMSTDQDTDGVVSAASLLANDTDTIGDTLAITSVSNPVHGSVGLVASTITFSPEAGFCGTGSFEYVVSDGALTDTGLVTVTINCLTAPAGVVDRADTATGNIAIAAPAGTLLAGVTDPEGDNFAVTVDSGATTQGGDFTIGADGGYTYNPPAGYEGADSFGYEVCDDATVSKCSTASVNLTVSGSIWFIDSNATTNGDGRLGTPFNSLEAFVALNGDGGHTPAAGDSIFLAASTELVPVDYTGGLTLLANQRLIGEGSSASLATATGITLAPNSIAVPATAGPSPALVTTGLTLANGNVVRGIEIRDTTGSAIAGSGISGLTLREVTISGAGADGISLQSLTGTVTLASVDVSASSGDNIAVLNSTGVLSLSVDAGHFDDASASGLSLTTTNSATTTYSITNSSALGASGAGIEVTSGLSSLSAGTIAGNTVSNVASSIGDGIVVRASDSSTSRVLINNNSVSQHGSSGIYVLGQGSASNLQLTLTNNSISSPGTNGIYGILVSAGSATPTDAGAVCAAITGNNAAGAGEDVVYADVRVRQRQGTTFVLPGYAGGARDAAAVAAFVDQNNLMPSTTDTEASVDPVTGSGFVSGGSCTLP